MNYKNIISIIILFIILVISICILKLTYIDNKFIITFENNLTENQISYFKNRFINSKYNLTFGNDYIFVTGSIITDSLKNELLILPGVIKVENVPNIFQNYFGNRKIRIGIDLSGGTLIYMQPNFSSIEKVTGKAINKKERKEITDLLYKKLYKYFDRKILSNQIPIMKDQYTIEIPLLGVKSSNIYRIHFPMITYNYNNLDIELIVVGYKISSPELGQNIIEKVIKFLILLLFFSIIFIIIFFRRYSFKPILLLINNFLLLLLFISLLNLEINQYSLLAFIISIIVININLSYYKPNKSIIQITIQTNTIFRIIINILLDINILFILISFILISFGLTSLYSFSVIIIINALINILFNNIFNNQLPTTSMSSAAF